MVPAWLGELIAAFINTVLVMGAVEVIKRFWPGIKEKFPWLAPIVPVILGPILTFLSSWLTSLLGFVVDLSPILGAFTGLIAIAVYDVGHGVAKVAVTRALARAKGK